MIIIYFVRVFHISFSWWFFTGVWVTARLLKSPGLFSLFWTFSVMLLFGWSPLVRLFPSPPVTLIILWLLYRKHQSRLVYYYYYYYCCCCCSFSCYCCRCSFSCNCYCFYSHHECPGYDNKRYDGEVPVMMELWGMRSIRSLPSLLSPLWFGMVAPDRVQSMGQVELNCVFTLNEISWNRTVFHIETVIMLNWIVWNRTILKFNCV